MYMNYKNLPTIQVKVFMIRDLYLTILLPIFSSFPGTFFFCYIVFVLQKFQTLEHSVKIVIFSALVEFFVTIKLIILSSSTKFFNFSSGNRHSNGFPQPAIILALVSLDFCNPEQAYYHI